MIQYDQAIPANAHPTVEIEYPAEKGAEPVRDLLELKERC